MARENKITAEEKYPISEQGYTTGKLLDGTQCQKLLDTRANKSFISKFRLSALQIMSFFTQVCFKNSEDPSGKQTMCECTFHNSHISRHS